MNSIPMSLLVYDNPPEYKTVGSYRTYLREKSNYSCAYCSISEAESSGATFNIDHFRPKSLFPKLETQCWNLRYSCPRCNSYKSNNWISKEDGCINDCSECKQHICKDNVERFVDVLIEDPSKIMYLKDDDKLYAYSGSKVGEYTIDYLRLNRMQLVRLRHVRRFMDNWEQLLCDKLSCVEKEIQSIQSQLIEFQNNSTIEETSKKIILTLFEMLEAQQENSKIFIEQELSNLRHLKNAMQCKGAMTNVYLKMIKLNPSLTYALSCGTVCVAKGGDTGWLCTHLRTLCMARSTTLRAMYLWRRMNL